MTNNLNQEVPILVFYMAWRNVCHLDISEIKTPSYNVANFFVSFIETITKTNFTIKSSFEFSKKIWEKNSEYFMFSLDIESLFTNTPSEETVKTCCNLLHKN